MHEDAVAADDVTRRIGNHAIAVVAQNKRRLKLHRAGIAVERQGRHYPVPAERPCVSDLT